MRQYSESQIKHKTHNVSILVLASLALHRTDRMVSVSGNNQNPQHQRDIRQYSQSQIKHETHNTGQTNVCHSSQSKQCDIRQYSKSQIKHKTHNTGIPFYTTVRSSSTQSRQCDIRQYSKSQIKHETQNTGIPLYAHLILRRANSVISGNSENNKLNTTEAYHCRPYLALGMVFVANMISGSIQNPKLNTRPTTRQISVCHT